MIRTLRLGCLTITSNKDTDKVSTRKALSAFLGTTKRTLSVGVSLTDWE